MSPWQWFRCFKEIGRPSSLLFLGVWLHLFLYLPWLIHIPAQFAKIQHAYWIERPTPSRFFTLLLEYVSNPTQSIAWTAFALFVALTVFAIGLFQTSMLFAKSRLLQRQYPRGYLPLLLGFYAAHLAIHLFSMVSGLSGKSAPPFRGFFVYGLPGPSRAPRFQILSGLFPYPLCSFQHLAGIQQHLTNTSDAYAPSDKIDAFLREHYQKGDVIIHSNKLSILPAFYFDPTLPQAFVSDTPGSPTDTLSLATQKILGVNSVPDLVSATNGASRIWFIILTRSIEEFTSSRRADPSSITVSGVYLSVGFA